MMPIDNKDRVQVSVICLAYNHEKYIRKTLEGFVRQKTNFKFEVLIHDDASTDHTASIIEEYVKKYPDLFKPIYQKENQHSKGVKINRIYNYPRAKGKYFAWCEGDDYWCDDYKLQKQYDALENHPECSVCVHTVQCINEDGSKNSFTFPAKQYGFTREGVLPDDIVAEAVFLKKIRYPFQTSSYFVRRENIQSVINGAPPYQDYLKGDRVILLTAFSEGHIYYINQILSCYRLFSEGSYTSRARDAAINDKYIRLMKSAEGELLYDKYTSERFHKWIFRSVSNIVIRCGAYNENIMDEFLKNKNIHKKDMLYQCSKKNRLKYYLSKYAHPLYLFLRRING